LVEFLINQMSLSNYRLALALLAFAATVALLAGCGGGSGDDSTSSGTEAMTKAAFIKRADAICAKTDKTQEAALEDFFDQRPNAKPTQALNEKVVVVVGLPAVQTEAEEIAALPVPEGDEDEIQAIVDGVEEAVEKGEADPSSLVGKGTSGPFEAVGKLAGEYGFKACALPV
jgi:hypothetical protein